MDWCGDDCFLRDMNCLVCIAWRVCWFEEGDFKKDKSKQIDIGACVVRFAVDDFWRDILQRSRRLFLHEILGDLFGYSPVHDVRFAESADHDVFRL